VREQVVEIRYKIMDEMRIDKLKQAKAERARLAARGNTNRFSAI